MDSEKDEVLVKRVQEGDILAFETLVKRYEIRLLRFTFRILHDEADAEEVVQDTFLNIYRAIERIDTKRKFSSYLYKVGKNLAISLIRRKKKEFSLNEAIVSDEEVEEVYDKLAAHEDRTRVGRALSFLSKKYRRVVKLYYFRELSYKEIGRELSLPINTVRTQLRRGRRMLKEVFENEKI